MWMFFHNVDCFLQCIIGQDGQNRSEYLFPHHCITESHIFHDRWRYPETLSVTTAPTYHLIRIDQSHDPVIMLPVNDLSVIWIFQGILPKLCCDLLLQR
mgnify:CR=1 FL=1